MIPERSEQQYKLYCEWIECMLLYRFIQLKLSGGVHANVASI